MTIENRILNSISNHDSAHKVLTRGLLTRGLLTRGLLTCSQGVCPPVSTKNVLKQGTDLKMSLVKYIYDATTDKHQDGQTNKEGRE